MKEGSVTTCVLRYVSTTPSVPPYVTRGDIKAEQGVGDKDLIIQNPAALHR